MAARIQTTRGICGGRPRIAGTRITVAFVLRMFAGGETFDTLLAAYPDLRRRDLEACLEYAAALADHADQVPAPRRRRGRAPAQPATTTRPTHLSARA